MAPRVSVVIVTWNGRDLLERFLPSVLATDYPNLEVVVADNASTDGSAEWLREAHPEVIVVRHPDNWLFARGNNAALEAATGDLICFLNNDVEVPPGWLRPLVGALEDASVAAVQPKLLQHDDRTLFEYAGGSGGFLDALAVPFTRGRILDTLEADRGQYDDARDVFWATGAAMLVRRAAFEDAGGFDESFGMHQEEIDLCWRLWRRGWRVRVEPSSEVYHLGGASLPASNPRKTYYNVRNSLVMIAKNLPALHAGRIVRGRRVLDTLAWAKALAAGDRAQAGAIRRGRRDAASMIADLEVDAEIALVLPPYRGRIVTDALLRGRRRFSDLPDRLFRPLGP